MKIRYTNGRGVFDGFMVIFYLNVRVGSVQVQHGHFRTQLDAVRVSTQRSDVIEFLHKRTVRKDEEENKK